METKKNKQALAVIDFYKNYKKLNDKNKEHIKQLIKELNKN